MIQAVAAPNGDYQDEMIWKPSPTGEFSLKFALNDSMEGIATIDWHNLIWFKGNIPKHSFFSWMAFHNGLKINKLLAAKNIVSYQSCPLCNCDDEDIPHLFIHCHYSS